MELISRSNPLVCELLDSTFPCRVFTSIWEVCITAHSTSNKQQLREKRKHTFKLFRKHQKESPHKIIYHCNIKESKNTENKNSNLKHQCCICMIICVTVISRTEFLLRIKTTVCSCYHCCHLVLMHKWFSNWTGRILTNVPGKPV